MRLRCACGPLRMLMANLQLATSSDSCLCWRDDDDGNQLRFHHVATLMPASADVARGSDARGHHLHNTVGCAVRVHQACTRMVPGTGRVQRSCTNITIQVRYYHIYIEPTYTGTVPYRLSCFSINHTPRSPITPQGLFSPQGFQDQQEVKLSRGHRFHF